MQFQSKSTQQLRLCPCHVLFVVQVLLQGPFAVQLQKQLEGLPPDAVQQLVGLLHDLAERIGQHGQQVRPGATCSRRTQLWLACACPAALAARQPTQLALPNLCAGCVNAVVLYACHAVINC